MTHKNDPKTLRAWAFFDWANSAHALVITVAIFPIYFNNIIDDQFEILGITFTDSSIFSYAISLSYLIIALLLPGLGGLADYSGRKLQFMRAFTYLGGLACVAMIAFTDMSVLWLGLLTYILGNVAFAGGQVFNNAFLPLIATKEKMDGASAQGFAFGYIGSVLLLMINLVMIQKPEWFGISDAGVASRLSFAMVGIWWVGFARICFKKMPAERKEKSTTSAVKAGWRRVKNAVRGIQEKPMLLRFLWSFFFYSMGVQTVLFLASTFAIDSLGFESTDLIMLIIMLQVVAIAGAYLFAWVAKKFGPKTSLLIMLVFWTLICITAFFIYQKNPFYGLAVFVGMMMGGIQSISRSTYAKMISHNEGETAAYFSLYDVVEKVAVVIGTFGFGLIDQITGSMRNSILSLAVIFLVSIIVMASVKFEETS